MVMEKMLGMNSNGRGVRGRKDMVKKMWEEWPWKRSQG
jgi:hypothetical protein